MLYKTLVLLGGGGGGVGGLFGFGCDVMTPSKILYINSTQKLFSN